MSEQERIRYHEYMRPRAANPTFHSSNVGATIGMLYWHEINSLRGAHNQQPRRSIYQNQQKFDSHHSSGLEPITQRRNSHVQAFQNEQYRPGNTEGKLNQARQMRNMPEHREINERRQNIYDVNPKMPSNNIQNSATNQPSRLSNLGSTSLNKFPRTLNERDIYEKQQARYNIISIQPKQYNETIKKYPKYHLENTDYNYFKKMELQNEYGTMKQRNSRIGNQNFQNNYSQYHQNYPTNEKRKQTPVSSHNMPYNDYNSAPMANDNPEYHSQQYRPKFANNVEELGAM